jgi:hypothetical protein
VVKVAVNVTGATVSIAGKDVGESGTLGPVRVNAGSVTVVARKSGYVDATKTIEAQGGSTVVVDLVLEAKTGVLRVQTNVEATITVDDKVAGRAPVELVVSSGPHRVVAIADGRETWSDTVLVPAGGTRTQTVTLAEKSGSRWWIWAGAGVVVASGIVLTWALVTDKKADHGSFQPGQVAAGLVRF